MWLQAARGQQVTLHMLGDRPDLTGELVAFARYDVLLKVDGKPYPLLVAKHSVAFLERLG